MNFGELRFWLLLLSGLAIILTAGRLISSLAPARREIFDRLALATLGLSLLLAVSWLTWLIFMMVLLIAFFGMKSALRLREPKRALIILLPLLFAPLIVFKYAYFISTEVLGRPFDFLRHVAIPVGISFYTFQKVALVVDTLVFRKPLPRFLDYLNFAAFFPQIVAGPIERRDDLLPQMEKFRFRLTPANLDEGLSWIALGLFLKCCLADNFALYHDRASEANPYLIWMTNLVFGLRIYYDFAGYSMVALGLAKCLGIRLTLNFTSPYAARNAVEFWRRWHITLSQWFRDYLYVPLGGGRTRFWMATILLVFVVSGVWHGAGWNFLLWGILHALYLIMVRLSGPWSLPKPAAWAATMAAVFFAWLFFYETRSASLWPKVLTLLNPAAYGTANLHAALLEWRTPGYFVLVCFFALALGAFALEFLSLHRNKEPYQYLRRPWTLILFTVLTVWLAPGKTNDFIYFAF